MRSTQFRRRDVLELLVAAAPLAGLAIGLSSCSRRGADARPADLAEWLARAIYETADQDEVTRFRQALAAEGADALPPWSPAQRRSLATALERHVRTSPAFRQWVGLTTSPGPVCTGLLPATEAS
jgi:hypothetical protein